MKPKIKKRRADWLLTSWEILTTGDLYAFKHGNFESVWGPFSAKRRNNAFVEAAEYLMDARPVFPIKFLHFKNTDAIAIKDENAVRNAKPIDDSIVRTIVQIIIEGYGKSLTGAELASLTMSILYDPRKLTE